MPISYGYARQAKRDFMTAKEKRRGIAESLLSPGAPGARANPPEEMMRRRNARLEAIGKKKGGGMFDFIYRKRKEREAAINEIDD